jgi:hypothetical protein
MPGGHERRRGGAKNYDVQGETLFMFMHNYVKDEGVFEPASGGLKSP